MVRLSHGWVRPDRLATSGGDVPRAITLVLAPDYTAACDWATRNGIPLAGWRQLTRAYQLRGYPGPIIEVPGATDRPDYPELIADVRARRIDVVRG